MKDDDLPLLSGTVPGLLDPSQPSRLLRTPTSSLFFATFDPLAARASNFPNPTSLHIEREAVAPGRVNSTSSNGKRIVVETDPENGTCSWRFVPRAKVDVALSGSEGPWPRLVELCGYVITNVCYISDPLKLVRQSTRSHDPRSVGSIQIGP